MNILTIVGIGKHFYIALLRRERDDNVLRSLEGFYLLQLNLNLIE